MNARPRAIEPLSQRLPKILAYPATQSMLLFLGALSLFRLLSFLPNILGLLFAIAFWVMGFKLAVEALVNTAQGRLEPLGSEELMATDSEAWRQLLLVTLFAVVNLAISAWLGPPIAWLVLGATLLVLPAAIILLAIDQSLPGALNPLAWFALIARLGGAYLGVIAVLVVLVVAATAIQWLLAAALPAVIAILPASFVALYLLVVSYHLMGYLLYERHEALGMDIEPAVPRATFASPLEDQAIANAEALADAGQFAQAADRLQEMFRGRGASDELHDRYRQYLALAGDKARRVQHGREYIFSLLATGKEKRALAVMAEVLDEDPGYQHPHPDDVARLVLQAERAGRSQLAVALAEGFEQRFPAHPQAAAIVLLATRLLADKLGREREAHQRLLACLPVFADDPLAGELRDAEARIRRLSEIATGS